MSRCSRRNLRKGPSGLADEINFEDFLTIMAYFQPIDVTMDEEQVQLCRKEKLRCAHPPWAGAGVTGMGRWVPATPPQRVALPPPKWPWGSSP